MSSIASIVIDKYVREANGEAVQTVPQVTDKGARPKPLKTALVTHALTEDQKQNKEAMKNALRHGIWVVEFTKMDGTDAVMECTLDQKYLPSGPSTVAATTRNQTEHLLHVYATDRLGWRSFSVANVKKFYKMPEAL